MLTLTVLDVPIVTRAWLREIEQGERFGPACPEPFQRWVATGEVQVRLRYV